MEIKETSVLLLSEDIAELMVICEDQDKDRALAFTRELKKKAARVQSEQRSTYQRGGHMGPARFK